MTQTLRRERIQKFQSQLSLWIVGLDEAGIIRVNDWDNINEATVNICKSLADASISRSEIAAEYKVEKKAEIPQNMSMDWYIANDLDIPEHVSEDHKTEYNALVAFEASFGVNTEKGKMLAWYGRKPEWAKLRKNVVELYKADPQCFEKYKAWRLTPYVKGAVSLKEVQRDADCFMASWAAFTEAQSKNDGAEEKIRLL